MAKLYLVRHGEPTGSWGTSPDPDPGLSEQGHRQASATAEQLALKAPAHIVSSPLRRASETAAPLAGRLQKVPLIAPVVAEIPTPAHVDQAVRGDWLRAIMAQAWPQIDPELQQWRARAVHYLIGISGDTAIFSHYVLINVAVGAAIGDDRVHCFAPAHASVTLLETNGKGLTLVELGATGTSVIR
jgi:broad specificity phosphatase PhoE